jgi:DNA-binding IclR family transcriptional regulator
VLLRQTTDASSPLAAVRYSPGFRSPILDRASGLVLLAHSSPQQSQMVLDLLFRDDVETRESVSRSDIESRMAEIRELGYACVNRPGRSSNRCSLAVPVRAGDDALAALVVRFARSAVTQEVIMERFLPALRGTAHAIVRLFGEDSGSLSGDAEMRPAHFEPRGAARGRARVELDP